MKHVSWLIALVVGFVLGVFTAGSLGYGKRGAPPAAPPSLAAAPRPRPSTPPPAVYRKVPLRADDPVRGSPQAPVTVAVFSDFQCPFCGRVEPTLKQVADTYGDKVRFVWKHQPLPMHPNAMPAAIASEAARAQGKFWEMHDKLFAAQADLSPARAGRIASLPTSSWPARWAPTARPRCSSTAGSWWAHSRSRTCAR